MTIIVFKLQNISSIFWKPGTTYDHDPPLLPPRAFHCHQSALRACAAAPVKETLLQLLALAWGSPQHETPVLSYTQLVSLTGKAHNTLRGHIAILRTTGTHCACVLPGKAYLSSRLTAGYPHRGSKVHLPGIRNCLLRGLIILIKKKGKRLSSSSLTLTARLQNTASPLSNVREAETPFHNRGQNAGAKGHPKSGCRRPKPHSGGIAVQAPKTTPRS